MNFHDELGIPVVFLSSGDHPDYHEPSDTADLIEYEKLSRTVRLVLRMLDSLQAAPLSP
jgi:aminopeptidase-like protein